MRSVLVVALPALFWFGCAPIETQRPSASCACDDVEASSVANLSAAVDVTQSHDDPKDRAGDDARTVSSDAPDRWATTRIGASNESARSGRPRRGRSVHIELEDTPFDEAARFLADAGGFNVVVEASGSPVTTSLHDVEPFDALSALAEARGLEITYERGVVIVR